MMEALGNCIFCGFDKSRFAFNITDIFDVTRQMRICGNCGTSFFSPHPDEAELARAYEGHYYGESETKFSWSVIEKTIDRFRMGRAKRMARLLKPGAKVLDIGCGNGRYLMYLSKLGDFELYGTELEGRSAERAGKLKGINLFTGKFEEAGFQENSFDSISLYHVFEHLTEPAEKLDNIIKLLKNDGVVAFSFPNMKSFQARLLRAAWLHFDPPRHLFLPDPKFFEKYLTSKGFILLRKKYFSIEQNPFGMTQGLLNIACKRRDVLYERLKGNVDYAPEYGKVQMLLQKIFFLWAMPHFMISDIFESLFNAGATIEMTFKKKIK